MSGIVGDEVFTGEVARTMDLAEAERLDRLRQQLQAAVRGRLVRVVRSVVYEGEGEAVLRQLARSLPEGEKEIGRAGRVDLVIRVAQGPMQDLGPSIREPDPSAAGPGGGVQ